MTLLLTIAVTHFVALISPGPDFVLVMRNSLTKTRQDGYCTALGFATGVAVHLALGFFGLGLLLQQSPLLVSLIQWLGIFYLLYIASRAWGAQSFRLQTTTERKPSRLMESYTEGLITNLLNAKAILFFVSLIVGLITPNTPLELKLSAMVIMVSVTFIWFALVARFLTINPIRERFLAAQQVIERTLAVLLVLMALKLSGLVERLLEMLA
jgi:threonine/homoserine/homoserine lactone efflux protein